LGEKGEKKSRRWGDFQIPETIKKKCPRKEWQESTEKRQIEKSHPHKENKDETQIRI